MSTPSEPGSASPAALSPARRALESLLERARHVADSPLVELDVRELLASWRTGSVLGFLTLAVGLAALGAAALSSEPTFRASILRSGMGQYLVSAAQLAIAAALTLFVPARALGLIDGPRWRGYFDQLVTSGLSPASYYLGRALSAQGLVALILVGTAPLVLALALADPPDWGTVLANEVLLAVYAELLLALTLGLGALVHETFAAVAAILLGVLFGFLSILPVPTALVALSPVRAIAGPIAAAAARLTPAEREVLFGPPRLAGVELPAFGYAVALSLAVGALAASACFVGRPHAFLPGLDSFGAVVLEGDRRRAAILRFRPVLVRRAELAFFFENQGPRHARLAPWARLARALGVLALVTALPLLALWDEGTLSLFTVRDHTPWGLTVAAGVFGALAVLAPLAFATSKNDAALDLELGRWKVPVVVGDLLAYGAFALGLLLLHDRLTEGLASSGALSFAKVWGMPFRSRVEAAEGMREWARVLALSGGALVLLQKVLGLRLNDAILGTAIAWLALGSTCFLLAAVDVSDMKASAPTARGKAPAEREHERSPEENAASLGALHLCPIFRLRVVVDANVLENVALPPAPAWEWVARSGFWAIYPALEVLLFLATLDLLRLRRRQAREAREAPLPPRAPVPS